MNIYFKIFYAEIFKSCIDCTECLTLGVYGLHSHPDLFGECNRGEGHPFPDISQAKLKHPKWIINFFLLLETIIIIKVLIILKKRDTDRYVILKVWVDFVDTLKGSLTEIGLAQTQVN